MQPDNPREDFMPASMGLHRTTAIQESLADADEATQDQEMATPSTVAEDDLDHAMQRDDPRRGFAASMQDLRLDGRAASLNAKEDTQTSAQSAAALNMREDLQSMVCSTSVHRFI